jgi:hypothetical protein
MMFKSVIVIVVDWASEVGTQDVKLNDIWETNDIVHEVIVTLADVKDDSEAEALFTNEVKGKDTSR